MATIMKNFNPHKTNQKFWFLRDFSFQMKNGKFYFQVECEAVS